MRRITQHITNLRLIPRASVVILSLLLLMMLYPAVGRNARVDAIELSEGQSMAERDADVSVIIQSAISLSLSSRIDIDAIPKANGNFSASTADLAVATNNASGYSIYMHTADNSPNLKAATGDETAFIAPVTGSVKPQNFAANTWGYSLTQTDDTTTAENLTYQAVPTTTAKIEPMNSAAQTERDYYQLHFGTMVDTTLPAGVYTNAIVLSVVANPREIQTLGEAVYMQDFDGTRDTKSKICAQSRVGETKQLIDTRDGKKYWVAKLADGNCWMTQNLALHLSVNKTYTPADTDVATDWSPTASTRTDNNFTFSDSESMLDRMRSWDLGKYVIVTPEKYTVCSSPSQTAVDDRDSVVTGEQLSQCADFQDVTGWSDNYVATGGTWNGQPTGFAGATSGIVTVNKAEKSYDAHYLIGTYYQYSAATAGGSVNGDNVSRYSICPKGWQLPWAGGQYDSFNSFYNLWNQYGTLDTVHGTGLSTNPNTAGKTYSLATEPLYYVNSGLVHTPTKSLRFAGQISYNWSRVQVDSEHAYMSHILQGNTKDTVNPSMDGYKLYAIPIRCLAK